MKCKCGREIENVPEHLKDLAEWVCKECSNTPPPSSLVGLTASGGLDVEAASPAKKFAAEHAA